MKYLKFLIPMGIFLVLVLFLGAGLKLDPKEVPSPLIGKPAPAFALARLDDPIRQKVLAAPVSLESLTTILGATKTYIVMSQAAAAACGLAWTAAETGAAGASAAKAGTAAKAQAATMEASNRCFISAGP